MPTIGAFTLQSQLTAAAIAVTTHAAAPTLLKTSGTTAGRQGSSFGKTFVLQGEEGMPFPLKLRGNQQHHLSL